MDFEFTPEERAFEAEVIEFLDANYDPVVMDLTRENFTQLVDTPERRAFMKKLAAKGADWILANDVSPASGVMGGADNTIRLLSAAGVEEWPKMPKREVADRLVAKIASALKGEAAR